MCRLIGEVYFTLLGMAITIGPFAAILYLIFG